MPLRPAHCLLALCIAVPAAAAAAPFASPPLDFSLHLSRHDTTLGDGAGRIDLSVKRAGIAAYANAEPRLHAGLLAGYAALSGGAFDAGTQSEGFYAGPAVRSLLLDRPRIAATLTGAYLFQRVRDETGADQRTLEWQQWQIELDGHWHVAPPIALVLGGRYGAVDAEQRLRGARNETRRLAADAAFGARAGLDFRVGGGRIGFVAEMGEWEGIDIYFQRQF